MVLVLLDGSLVTLPTTSDKNNCSPLENTKPTSPKIVTSVPRIDKTGTTVAV